MHLQFADALELGKPRRTREGYWAVRARTARTGVYRYTGAQVDPDNKHGLRDKAIVNVLRDEDTVFDAKAVQSFIGKPITIDHPREPVTAANWKEHSRGAIMGALRDGQYLAFDLLLMDAAAIADVEAGKRELSNGYSAEIEVGDFAAPDGTKCEARQSRIFAGNHIACLDAGRAGPECRIADGGNDLFENCDAVPVIVDGLDQEKPVSKFITLDGLKVDLADAEAVQAAIAKLQGQAKDAADKLAEAETQVATLTTEKATLDAKVATLEQQVADAAITPAKLRDAAKAYAAARGKAKALGVTVADEADEPAIMKAVVSAKLGDKAKDWNETQIAASFAGLTADVKTSDEQVFGFDARLPANDADKEVKAAYEQMVADMTGAKTAAA